MLLKHHGRWGILFAGFLKLSILFIMVFPGLIARILYPDLPNQDLAYPTLVFNSAIIVSLISKTPTIETDLIWTKEFYDAETRELQNLAWYQNYRVLSVLLLSLTAWVVVSYW